MFNRRRLFNKKIIAVFFGLIIAAFFSWFFITSGHASHGLLERLNYLAYDLRLRANLGDEIKVNHPIVIVDIDAKSLAQQGRWPWPRAILATLLKNAQQSGATVVAFDIIFAETEANAAKSVLDKLIEKNPNEEQLKQSISSLIEDFNYDMQFSKQLQQGDSVLGMIFDPVERESIGNLPEPLLKLNANDRVAILGMSSYTTAIPILQQGAKNSGFMTIIPDEDGVIRRAPLVLRLADKVYPSLALEAVRLYLLVNKIQLKMESIAGFSVLNGIYLGDTLIPTDESGQMLIPYGNLSKKVKIISAIDVINNKIPSKLMENALVLVGSSDITMGDLKATPLDRVYPGVKIQGVIAAGLLEKHIPYEPDWADGVALLTLIILGFVLSLLLPFLSGMWLVLVVLVTLLGLVIGDVYLWQEVHIGLPIALPSLLVLSLGTFNMTYGFISERAHSRQLKSMFDQYVPPAHIDEMLKGEDSLGLEGESREMSVLFADIRDFTSISEKLSVTDLKKLLNQYFNKVTDIILAHEGTVDKYIGDMVMAFWGAPLRDPQHAYDAIVAALEMQEATRELQDVLTKMNLPKIQIGIGINTGMMNIGDMGSTFRRNYTVLGDAVNLGSRLEAITKFYNVGIIVSEFTKLQAEEFLFLPLDRIRVKGKQQAIEIYEPLGFKNESTAELIKEVKQCQLLLNYYYRQEWDKALLLCQQLQKTYPSVHLYQLYQERLRFLQKNPPGSTWDGVYTFTSKA